MFLTVEYEDMNCNAIKELIVKDMIVSISMKSARNRNCRDHYVLIKTMDGGIIEIACADKKEAQTKLTKLEQSFGDWAKK